jgi:hypothetical protein
LQAWQQQQQQQQQQQVGVPTGEQRGYDNLKMAGWARLILISTQPTKYIMASLQ